MKLSKQWISLSAAGFLLLLTLSAYGKLDGKQLHSLTMAYETPHLAWGPKSTQPQLRTLFIVPRKGAREVIEILQRLPMDFTEYLCYDHTCIAKNDMYDAPYEGTSYHEKQQELSDKLQKDYDLIILGEVLFRALPDEAKYFILSKVEKGAGLLLVQLQRSQRLPYRRLYEQPLAEPEFLADFPPISVSGQSRSLQISRLGRGRVVHVSYQSPPSYGLSLTPYIPYNREWAANYENAMAWLARLCLWTGGREDTISCRIPALVSRPSYQAHKAINLKLDWQGTKEGRYRLRNQFNEILLQKDLDGEQLQLPPLPPGRYFCDLLLQEGTQFNFQYYEFEVFSPLGTVSLHASESWKQPESIRGRLEVEKPYPGALQLQFELLDSPYYQVWQRQTQELPAGTASLDWEISDYYLPTIAGILRVEVSEADSGRILGWTEKTLFFPDYKLDDYVQMSWNNLDESVAPFTAPILIDRLGWNLGLSHPTAGGDNARASALFNQRFVPYMTRICITKGAGDASKQYRWFFLPGGYEDKVKALEEDECFYRPEVQELWADGIAHRIQNLPKYSPVIYNLGDENSLDVEAGFGPSDLLYFRRFLQEKYGSIARLNQEWQSNYGSFQAVPHLRLAEAKEQGNFPAWYDHRQYMEKMYADIHHFLAAEIKKHDPQARVGAEGSVPGELEQTIDSLEFWGPYSNLVQDEALRSFGADRIRMLWWGGYPGSHGGRSEFPMPILGDVLKGTINGNSWYTVRVGNHGALTCDYDFAPYVQNYLPYLDDLRWGQATLLINNPQINSGIGLYWSHASGAARMLDERCHNPSDGIGTLIRYFYQRGQSFEFVSSRTLSRLQDLRVLVLCGVSALSEDESQAILDFAARGGVVIADLNPGILNGYLRPVTSNALAPLFGNQIFTTLPEPELGPVQFSENWRGQQLRFQAAKALHNSEVPFFVQRRHGKGEGILLNFGLATAESSAEDEIPFAGFLDQFFTTAACPPPFQISGQDKFSLIRTRQGREFQLLGVLLPEKQVGSRLKIDLGQRLFIYEAKKGLVGNSKTLDLAFPDTPFKLLSVFSEAQEEPALVLNTRQLLPGGRLELDLRQLPAGRVYYLKLQSPDGRLQTTRNRVFDRDKMGDFLTLHFSYSDQPGTWKISLEDVATGLSTAGTIQLQ